MLEEQSGQYNDYVSVPVIDTEPKQKKRFQNLEGAISEVLAIENAIELSQHPQGIMQYRGKLRVPAEDVLDTLEPKLAALGVHAYFSKEEDIPTSVFELIPGIGSDPPTPDQAGGPLTNAGDGPSDGEDRYKITVFNGRFDVKPRNWIINAVLFVLTMLSLFFLGASIEAGGEGINSVSDFLKGWQYAFGLMLILGAHELGHYFAARHHDVAVTLPYFIPMPFGIFGTLGAFIQLREPMRNKNVLFDVGAAGPLAGLFFAIPILIYGLATSDVHVAETGQTFIREGNSILYALSKYVIFGEFLPDGNRDVLINQFAQAGWTGLFVTALNLMPVGQLDGGHIMYTLLGKRARLFFWPVIIVMGLLFAFVSDAWLLWTLLLFFFGRNYAVPLDDVSELSQRRKIIGIIALIIFVLIFIPNPIEILET